MNAPEMNEAKEQILRPREDSDSPGDNLVHI